MIIDSHVRVVVEETPTHYYMEIQTDTINASIVDPSFPSTPVRDFVIEYSNLNIPTAIINSPTDLAVRAQVGTAIIDDDTTFSANPTLETILKLSVLRKSSDESLEVWGFSKTTGNLYGDLPAGYILEIDRIENKEWKIQAAGTVIEEM